MSGPRLLAIFGSGETSRRAVEVYRELCARFEGPVTAVVLGTTCPFQENAAGRPARARGHAASGDGSSGGPRRTAARFLGVPSGSL